MNIPHINIGTNNGSIQVADNIYNGQAAATKVAEAEDAVVVEEKVSAEVAARPRGRSRAVLFVDADGKEDMAVREQEKQHLLDYLRAHKLSGASLSAAKGDTLNQTIAGFVRYWKRSKLIAESAGATAVYDFLTNDCGIPNATQKKAITNKWREFFKDTDYGKQTYYDIKDSL